MATCAVYGCNNRTEVVRGTYISLHKFPKDQKLRARWVALWRRKDKFHPDNYRMCSIHFSFDDHERDLEAELLNLDRKPKLKASAVPYINMPDKLNIQSNSSTEIQHRERRTCTSRHVAEMEAKEQHRNILNEVLHAAKELDTNGVVEATDVLNMQSMPEPSIDYKSLYENLIKGNETLSEQIKRLQDELGQCRNNVNDLKKLIA